MLSIYAKRIINALKRNKIIVILLLVFSCVGILQMTISVDLYFINFETVDVTTCYYSSNGDALQAITEDFSPPSSSIHFHETSCRGGLNTRQACAIESAARTHPDWQINVFFSGSVSNETLNMGTLNTLKKYPNIMFLRLHLIEYAKGTPLEKMIAGGALNRTRWRIPHTSDALRYLTLYKWGGVYLDLDVVVAKSFDELARNWAARESDVAVAAGALSFSRDEIGRRIAEAAIRDFEANFRGDVWGNNGPGVITRTLTTMCEANTISDMSAQVCQGFEVYGPELFYPVSWSNAKDYFDSKELSVGDPYVYHVWNKMTKNMYVDRRSAYAHLAEKYCPKIVETFGDNFGL